MGGAETVKEVDERHTALNGRQVRHRGQVHDLLGVGLGQHGEAGLAGGVDVAVIAKDVQRLGGDGTGRNIKDAGQLLGCDLVHVGDHQQQALGCGEGGGDGAGAKRTVNRTGRAGFGLHLDHLDLVAEDVFQAGGRPLVDRISHRAGGRDRVNRRHVGEGIRYVCRSGIAVHRLFCSGHFSSSVYNIQHPPCVDRRQTRRKPGARADIPFPPITEREHPRRMPGQPRKTGTVP